MATCSNFVELEPCIKESLSPQVDKFIIDHIWWYSPVSQRGTSGQFLTADGTWATLQNDAPANPASPPTKPAPPAPLLEDQFKKKRLFRV